MKNKIPPKTESTLKGKDFLHWRKSFLLRVDPNLTPKVKLKGLFLESIPIHLKICRLINVFICNRQVIIFVLQGMFKCVLSTEIRSIPGEWKFTIMVNGAQSVMMVLEKTRHV